VWISWGYEINTSAMLIKHGLSAILVFVTPTYPAVVRLLGEDLRLTSGDGEVGLRDLEDLGVVQFAVIMAMTECLVVCQTSASP